MGSDTSQIDFWFASHIRMRLSPNQRALSRCSSYCDVWSGSTEVRDHLQICQRHGHYAEFRISQARHRPAAHSRFSLSCASTTVLLRGNSRQQSESHGLSVLLFMQERAGRMSAAPIRRKPWLARAGFLDGSSDRSSTDSREAGSR